MDQSSSTVINQDPDELYADLFDSLFVQCLLQHSSMSASYARRPPKSDNPTAIRSNWHRFMDNLCFLSDWKCGGKGVTALGAQKKALKTVFWLATTTTNPDHQDDILAHLEDIFGLLKQSLDANARVRASIATKIAQLSILHSPQRVNHYGRKLSKLIDTVKADNCCIGTLLICIKSRHMLTGAKSTVR